MRVFGAGGVELNEEWGGDARAYLGMTVPGFPNFFMLYGPNTNLVINGSILIMVECQVRYAVEAIGALLRARPPDHVVPARRPRALRPRDGGGQRQDGLGRGRRPDLVPQRARAGHAELALRPPHLLVAHAASPTWPTTSWPEHGVPSRELTEILALVPPDFADPEADYRAVRATMAPFHGHPVPPHVTVTEAELGGVRCAWYDDTRAPRRDRVVFHCHGGGLVSCPLDDYHFYGAMLAEQLEARVVMADYRLAPEHPFPAAHEDCLRGLPRAAGRRGRPGAGSW